MKPLCTVEEIRAAERRAISAGVSEADLMHRAGTDFADEILAESDKQSGAAVILVGPGNNGGDGIVAAARLIERGWTCSVFPWRRTGAGNAPVGEDLVERITWLRDRSELEESCRAADVIVDAVFGIGGRAELPSEVADAFRIARAERTRRGTPLWALDIPSGMDADSGATSDDAFMADVTAMLGLPKIGVYRAPALRFCGQLRLIEIGLDAPAVRHDRPVVAGEDDARQALIRRPRDAHKSSVGWLLVIGGAPNYFGAPRLAGEAAARAGAGLVCLAVPRSLVPPIAASLPEATFLPLPETELGGAGSKLADMVRAIMPRYRAMVIGPGLGREHPVDDFLASLFNMRAGMAPIGFGTPTQRPSESRFETHAVIDADALNWLSLHPDWPNHLRRAKLVLTPHPGELSRLMGLSIDEIVADPWSAARAAAARFGQVVVLKHAHAIAAAPDGRLVLSPQSQPALATAGSGDVLGGVIGGLLAQGMEPFKAAWSGLVVGAMAAEISVREIGTLSLVATDVIDALPQAMMSLYDARW